MARNIAQTTLVIALSATCIVSTASTAQAEDPVCSLAKAAGSYAVSDSGTVIGVGPRAAVAMVKLDAAGNIKGPVTANLNGGVTNTMISGTYTVNPDCTGTMAFGEFDKSGNLQLTVTLAVVWDDNLRVFHFLFTSAVLADGTSVPIVINGDATKVNP